MYPEVALWMDKAKKIFGSRIQKEFSRNEFTVMTAILRPLYRLLLSQIISKFITQFHNCVLLRGEKYELNLCQNTES